MAIVIEEEKNGVNPMLMIGWGVILIIIVLIVYFIFFRRPELISIDLPEGFEITQQISQISLDADTLIGSENFRERQQYIPLPVPTNLGRSNPFLPL